MTYGMFAFAFATIWLASGLVAASKDLALDVRYQPMPLPKYNWQLRKTFWENLARGPFAFRFGLWFNVLTGSPDVGFALPSKRVGREAWRLQLRESRALKNNHPRALRHYSPPNARRRVSA